MLNFIILVIVLVVLIIYLPKIKSMMNGSFILDNWDKCIVFYSLTHKEDVWDIIYNSGGKYYQFKSRSGTVIDNQFFSSKYECFMHLRELKSQKIIDEFYINASNFKINK